jgi:hypothetical protein
MSTRVRLVFALCGAVLALGFGTQAGNAVRLELGLGSVRMSWGPPWSILRFQNGAIEVACPLTLESTFRERVFAKVAASTVGSINSASIGTCTGGSITFLRFPWAFKYHSYAGTLPNITSMILYTPDFAVNIRDTIDGTSVQCLYQANANEPLFLYFLREPRNRIAWVSPPELGNGPIPYSGGSGTHWCPAEIYVGGSTSFGVATYSGSWVLVELFLSAI